MLDPNGDEGHHPRAGFGWRPSDGAPRFGRGGTPRRATARSVEPHAALPRTGRPGPQDRLLDATRPATARVPRRVLFLGGNGHAVERLAAARRALRALPAGERFELIAIPYPGFEGRPRVETFEEFLDATRAALEEADPDGRALVYATGIGALVALALRARGGGPQRPLLIQGGVLWGLEERLFPRLMRGPAPRVLRALFRARLVQARFVRRHLLRHPSDEERAAFFRGYARCSAFPDLFRWLTPDLLRALERAFAARPAALSDVRVWWGARDSVVSLDELTRTQAALGTSWPVRVFPTWGHYPMLDAPAEWVRALGRALAPAPRG